MEGTVIVLGDLARSPRMINHVTSLLSEGIKVRLIGYHESNLPNNLTSSKNLTIHSLSSKSLARFKQLSGRFFLIYAFLRLSFESLQLFFYLLRCYKSKFILIQNPPSMPVLLISYITSCLTNTSLIIDWHNYAWSLLKIAKKSRKIVNLAYFYEVFFGKLADSGFCVSKNMQSDLDSLKIRTFVLYDRPVHRFSSNRDMRKFFNVPNEFFFLVSSTSWTIDEDFSIVFDALEKLSQSGQKIFLVITGKGPLKQHYTEMINKKKWQNIRIEMPWLEIEDYPAVLEQADLGICLHISSSGLDLPMKVVDMQQAALPVLVYNYKTITEFVQDGVNGELFETSNELFEKIITLSRSPETLQKYRRNLKEFKKNNSWENEWSRVVKPTLVSGFSIKIRFLLTWVLVLFFCYLLRFIF